MIQREKVDLFLDSGAFSAWTQGTEININEYIAFVQKHQDIIEVYANLDVIGDPKATWKNQKIMEAAGLTPLPTFHYGEDIKWLERYLRSGYDYIALGGMVPISTSALRYWLDNLFQNYLCTPSGIPKVKVHGFGLTSLPLMLRYPWYSMDSTSWKIVGRLGGILVPRNQDRQWVYNKNPWKVSVSTRSPGKKEAGKHIDTLKPKERHLVIDYIHEKGYRLGKSRFQEVTQTDNLNENERWAEDKPKDRTKKRLLEIIEKPGICNDYQLRDELNIVYFLDLEKSRPVWPWPFISVKKSKGFGV